MTPIEKLAEDLVSLNVKDLLELKKVLKDKYDIEEVIPVAAAPVAVEEKKAPEKSEFDVYLTKVSEVTKEKLASVKVINEITGAGLQGAMALTKELPVLLKNKVSKTEAEEMKAKLAEYNAIVELR